MTIIYKKIIIKGKIITHKNPWAYELHIKNDKIIYLGTPLPHPENDHTTLIINLKENELVLPGFIDSHCHPIAAALQKMNCKLKSCNSLHQAVEALTKHINSNKTDHFIFASGFIDEWLLGNEKLPIEILDELSQEKFLVVTRFDGHAYWCNSLALKQAGISYDSKSPSGGEIGKKGGSLDGLIHDEAMQMIRKIFPPLSEKKLDRALDFALKKMLRKGITCFADASTKEIYLNTYIRKYENSKFGFPKCNVILSNKDFEKESNNGIIFSNEIKNRCKNANINLAGIKLFLDGVAESKSACLIEKYLKTEHRGSFNLTKKELEKIISNCSKNKISLHYHVVGDSAFRNIIQMIKENESAQNIFHTLAHVQFVDENDAKVANELKDILNVCFSPFWFYKDSGYLNMISLVGLKGAFNSYPINYFKQNVIGFGSDWPVSSMNPFKCLEVAITRSEINECDNLFDKLNEAHCLSIDEALYNYTMGSAKLLGLEKTIGSIEIGKKADLIIIDQNIFEIEKHLIHKTKVLTTIIDGRIMFDKRGL